MLEPLPHFKRRKSFWPAQYGYWENHEWNISHFVAKENSMATELGLPWWVRGPPGPELGGPDFWKSIPWNSSTQHWTWTRFLVRELLTEYNWEDWNDPKSLEEEHALAAMHHLPWNVRGPPGPKQGGPQTWRGMKFREGADKWMNRGSQKPGRGSAEP